MMPHVHQTLEDLRAIQTRIGVAIQVLELVDPESVAASGGVLPNIPPMPPRGLPITNRELESLPLKTKTAKGKPIGKIDARVLANPVLRSLAALPEPMSPRPVSEHAKVTWKNADNFMQRMEQKGWLKRIGPGHYNRTAKFPELPSPAPEGVAVGTGHHAPAAGPTPPAPPNGNRAQVQRDYEQACRARDNAVASGNDKLAEINQKRVDQLAVALGID